MCWRVDGFCICNVVGGVVAVPSVISERSTLRNVPTILLGQGHFDEDVWICRMEAYWCILCGVERPRCRLLSLPSSFDLLSNQQEYY